MLHELFADAVCTAPERPALIDDDGAVLTFAELESRSAALAGWLGAHSAPGDRVAVVADNSIDYAIAYYGVPRSGRILTLINQRLSAAEQSALIAAARPRLLLGDVGYLAGLGGLRSVSFGSAEWQAALDHSPFAGTPPGPDDPAWLVFTSGSTGAPKGAVHTHRSLAAGVRGSVEGRAVPPADVYLFPFPMCHIAGYNVMVRHATASTVVLSARFRPAEFVATVNRHAVASCSLAPTMLHALLDHVATTGATMPSLREVAYGSSAISADLIDRATAVLHVDFHQGYGMTEAGGNVTFLGPDDHRRPALLRSAGRPHRNVEVAIEPGSGEVLVRGAQVMSGYWNDAPASAAALAGGWLHTGDIGHLDDDGRLWIVDRAKDVIITGGENVGSREVEDALSTHPHVEQVAVVGVPDPYWGEAICAVVVARHDHPSAEALTDHVRTQISAFKRPRHIVFVDALPLTTNGKIAKDRVRELARERLHLTVPD